MTDQFTTLLAQIRDLNESVISIKDKITLDRQAAELVRQGKPEETKEEIE
jgi:hypothetical protein